MWFLVLPLVLISSSLPGLSLAEAGDTDVSNPVRLSRTDAALLTQWFEHLGEPRTGETFGDFLSRAAILKWHSPYATLTETNGPERLRIDLARFDCVSLIDTSLSVARCAWVGDTTEACFARELVATRYRDGRMSDFASRLHYLEDWLDDNRARHRIEDRTRALGGLLLRRHFHYMSEHSHRFPAMADPQTREAIAITEARLSNQIFAVMVRSSIRDGSELLQNGDVVGVVTTEPGRLISHAGLVVRNEQKGARLLHASSHHRRVILTTASVAQYILRRRERWGIIVARPRPPVATRLE